MLGAERADLARPRGGSEPACANSVEAAEEPVEPLGGVPDRRRLRRLLAEQYEPGFVIRDARQAPGFGGLVFVVDAAWEGDQLRFLGSLNRNGALTQQSVMSRSRPDRLVFAYERLMALAFGLVERPRAALLLGLGSGAMWRHLRGVLPECDITIVEFDPVVIKLARRHFFLNTDVVEADAKRFVEAPPRRYDVILVDLYHAGGVETHEPEFWDHCLGALEPGGLVAVNWAEFYEQDSYRRPAEQLATRVPGTFYVTPRDMKDNLIQFAPTEAGFREDTLLERLTAFDRRHRPMVLGNGPRSRSALKRCVILDGYPAIAHPAARSVEG